MARLCALLFAPVLVAPALASAQCPEGSRGCFDDAVMFMWSDRLFDTIDLDSGWVPAGSPIQVRVGLHLAGETQIDMMGTTYAFWPMALSILPVGLAGGGRFSVDYGLEITARIRFNIRIGLVDYRWEGDIPLPGGIPRDLRMADEAFFDPFVLPGAMPLPVALTDSTATVEVFDASIGGLIGSVAGAVVDGGFTLGVRGQLDAGYRGERIDVLRREAPGSAPLAIVRDGDSAIVPAPGASGYGPAEDVAIDPIGRIEYTGSLVIEPAVFIEILGRRTDLLAFSVPVPIVDTGASPDFSPAEIHVPLPDVAAMPDSVAFGRVPVGERAVDMVRIQNLGEATLDVTPTAAAAPFEIATDTITIPPRGERALEIAFVPERAGVVTALIGLTTNDPDRPSMTIRVSGDGEAVIAADAGPVRDAGRDASSAPGVAGGACGCRAGRHSAAPLAPLFAALMAAALRRR